MPTFYNFNDEGEYISREDFSMERYLTLPEDPNRTILEPNFQAGFWPVWDGLNWDLIEDHRGESGFVNGEFVKISALGPLPEGWSKSPPLPPVVEPDPEVQKQSQIWVIEAELEQIDQKSRRPARAILANLGTSADHEKLASLETQATELRAKLAELKG